MHRHAAPLRALLLAVLAVGCSDAGDLITGPTEADYAPMFTVAAADVCGTPLDVTFLAGQNIQAGVISVVNSEDEITVTFHTVDGWAMTESHLAVVTHVSDFPTNKSGNPKVGNFPLKASHDPAVTDYSYTVSLADLGIGEGDVFFVSAQADVSHESGAEEGAWGEGTRFVPKGNWAMYFSAEVQGCKPPPGTDVVVFNDVNVFDNTGMANPNNRLMARNLVDYTHAGPRGSGTVVWFDRGHNGRWNPYYTTGSMRAEIQAAGYTVVDVRSSTGGLTSIPAEVKVVFLWTPMTTYTPPEVNTLKKFAAEGGRVVYIGEWARYYGVGIGVENKFLLDMGAVMTNSGGAVDCLYQGRYPDLPAASLRPHQITDGMDGVRVACASVIIPGPNDYPLFYDKTNTQVLAGVATIDVTPLPLAASSIASFKINVADRPLLTKDQGDPSLNPNSSTGR